MVITSDMEKYIIYDIYHLNLTISCQQIEKSAIY